MLEKTSRISLDWTGISLHWTELLRKKAERLLESTDSIARVFRSDSPGKSA
jgi:hypothetical protein